MHETTPRRKSKGTQSIKDRKTQETQTKAKAIRKIQSTQAMQKDCGARSTFQTTIGGSNRSSCSKIHEENQVGSTPEKEKGDVQRPCKRPPTKNKIKGKEGL